MKMQKRFRSGIYWGILGVLFTLVGCAPLPSTPKYESKCTGPSPPAVLAIRLDAAGVDPVEVVDKDGKNADILIVCPGTSVSWSLPGDRSFKIKFKRQAPFAWTNDQKDSSPGSGKHELVDNIKSNAEYDGYKYTISVKNSSNPLDPIIIVER